MLLPPLTNEQLQLALSERRAWNGKDGLGFLVDGLESFWQFVTRVLRFLECEPQKSVELPLISDIDLDLPKHLAEPPHTEQFDDMEGFESRL